jgi:hypothetical protein
MAADRDYMADQLPNTSVEELRSADDPKGIFDRARRVWGAEATRRLSDAVARAPMARWLALSGSFERFYEDCRDLSQRLGCTIPNERESPE